jgi:signal transduction histidine kinase
MNGTNRLYAALPVVVRGDVDGVVWLSAPLHTVMQLNTRTWEVLGTVGAIVLVLAVVSGWALARRLSRRLGNLADAAHRLGDDLSTELPVHGRDEVAELAVALNEMADRIRATLERQTEFVAAASHQLRTPLTAIRLRIDELREIGLDDPLSAEYMDEMADQVVRLERLSIQLLGLLSAERRPTQGPVPVDDAVADAIQSVAPLAHRRGVRIDVRTEESNALVNAPVGALEQVLLNLIDNAVKYTRSYVGVDVSRNNGAVEITVTDDGPGVDSQARARAFDAFYKGPGAGPGFGLGLAIAKRISEASNADVTLEDDAGGGLLARVRWPAC